MIEIIKEKYAKSGRISIRPLVDPNVPNMGLENYGLVVFPGTHQREPMACVEANGRLRYLNGLDESAPEIKGIQDDEKRKAKIREIRSIVAMLEFEKHYNTIDIEDPEFWNKVQTYKPNNSEFWSKIDIECDNNTIILDPVNKTEDLLKVLAIEAGGFPIIAKSLEDCKSGITKRKWYLDRQIDTASNKASSSKLKNKALTILTEISEENPRKLFYIAKLIDTNSMQYKNTTIQDVIYDNMDEFINGYASEPNIKKAANRFMDISGLDMQELKIRSMVKDATFYKIIILKGDGLLYYGKENVMLGRNPSEVYEYLSNPMNEDVLVKLQTEVEKLWSE
jgi:hypothetical protein